MDSSSLFVIAAVPLICVAYFAISFFVNRNVTAQRDSASTLTVLSGMLAALAILIPLLATLLPEEHFAWPGWLLVGALLAGVFSMFGTIYSMISLQGKAQFVPNTFPYIPCWVNATWFALALLALSGVIAKAFPAGLKDSNSTKGHAQARFVVARDLPHLGSSRQVVETQWGMPARESNSELVYWTEEGAIVFCLDTKEITQSITETKESDANAVRTHCK